MAQRPDIQYIRHSYTHGTAAKKLVFRDEPKKAPLPLLDSQLPQDPEQKVRVFIDPLFISSVAVMAVLVCLMLVSLFQFTALHREQVALQEYVYELSNENTRLEKTYREGFDLTEIQTQALALGMIPSAEAQTMMIDVQEPEAEEPLTFLESVQQVFAELFANVNF